jgi:DNA modification methylase
MGYSIHFSADNELDKTRKVLRLQLGKKYFDLNSIVKNTSSETLRNILNVDSYHHLKTLASKDRISVNSFALKKIHKHLNVKNQNLFRGIEGTYRGDTKDFFHHLFPYLEAFSPNFVSSIRKNYAPEATVLLDPFGGLGTAPFTFLKEGGTAYFCEVNPLMQHIAYLKSKLRKTPLAVREELIPKLKKLRTDLSQTVDNYQQDTELRASYFKAFEGSNYFNNETLEDILKLRTLVDKLYCQDEILSLCLELSVIASLVPASNMQRAGDLRRKRADEIRRSSTNIRKHVAEKIQSFEQGLLTFGTDVNSPFLLTEDCRILSEIPSREVDLIITSPPYLNGTNYFRNTKIELWFIRIIQSENDLGKLRDRAITAGINDVRGIRSRQNPEHTFTSLNECITALDKNSYDRRIPQMVKWYGNDLYNGFKGAISHLKNGGVVAVDIGDSIYCEIKVPTDLLVQEILELHGCEILEKIIVRKRVSRSGAELKQVCVVAKKKALLENKSPNKKKPYFEKEWNSFRADLPHTALPYSNRNWGHQNHSLCSYQGKLKPAIAKFLVDTFVPSKGRLLDPFAGVGTIPFEAALSGKKSFGFDISPSAIAISKAKLWIPQRESIHAKVLELAGHINNHSSNSATAWLPNFNKELPEYFHPRTLDEIICARNWFQLQKPWDEITSLLLTATMHVLHGNRPYALSRRSHPITPFAPTGEFEYKSLIEKINQKLNKTLNAEYPKDFVEGSIYFQDAVENWPLNVIDLNAVITSPPFFDSTRFHLANWMRLWFAGWEKEDFKYEQRRFIDEKQKDSFACYESIIRQSKERLNINGVVVFHLGKSKKCDMAEQILAIGKYWFNRHEMFNESVKHCESHGIRDKGTVTDHQYLVLY